MGSLADGHDSERVEEETQQGKRHREREGEGGNLSGRGTQTWCFIVSWPFKTTTATQRRSMIYLFICDFFWLITVIFKFKCVWKYSRVNYIYIYCGFCFLPSRCLIFSYLLLNCLQNVYFQWYALFMTLARTVPFAAWLPARSRGISALFFFHNFVPYIHI